jgi:pyruvate formate-lyase activating enzyme-like uncharacterized protein
MNKWVWMQAVPQLVGDVSNLTQILNNNLTAVNGTIKWWQDVKAMYASAYEGALLVDNNMDAAQASQEAQLSRLKLAAELMQVNAVPQCSVQMHDCLQLGTRLQLC